MCEQRMKFVEQVVEYQHEMDELYNREENRPQTLEEILLKHFRVSAFAKQLTLRIPRHLVAQLDVLLKWGPWETRTDMLTEMIENALQDVAEALGEKFKEQMRQAAQEALDDYGAEQAAVGKEVVGS